MQNFTQAALADVQALVNTYANIAGDYEATLLCGVWHYMCDSGIYTDAFSEADAEYVEAHYDNNVQYYNDDDCGYTDAFYAVIFDDDKLQCNAVLQAQDAIANKHNLHNEDVARMCMQLEAS